MNEQQYTISELADAAGVTLRTVRYYLAEGLLPPPDSRGRYTLYNADHLNRLRLIARLKDAYLPLQAIKARLDELDTAEVEQVLQAPPAATPPTTSAAEYLAQVLHPPAVLREQSSTSSTNRQLPVAPPQMEQPHQPSAPPRPAPPSAVRPPAAPAPPPAGESAQAIPGPLTTNEVNGSIPASVSWERVALAPGVELHVATSIAQHIRHTINELVDQARSLLAQSDEGD